MATAPHIQETDPVDFFDSVIEETWRTLCETYDIIADRVAVHVDVALVRGRSVLPAKSNNSAKRTKRTKF